MKQLFKPLLWVISLSIGIGSLFLVSCEQDEKNPENPAELSVSTEELTFFATSEAQPITITSNVDWDIKHDDWIETDTESGKAGENIPVNVSVSNLGSEDEARTGTITVSAGTITHIIAVSQFNITLDVSTYTLKFNDVEIGVDKNLTITSSEKWTAEASDWLKLSAKQGKVGKTKITVTASLNTEEGERSGTITISAGTTNEVRRTVVAIQAKEQRFKVYDAFIADYEADSKKKLDKISLSDLGKIRKIKISASSAWTIATNSSWLTITPQSGTAGITKVSISAEENKSTSEGRNGEITITMNGVSEAKTIPVEQGLAGNYHENGADLTIQTHTKGEGVAVVLAGDGFDREDMKKGGRWETKARFLANLFLTSPIIEDFKEYFDIYVLMSESEERGVLPGTNNNFGPVDQYNFNKLANLVKKLPGIRPTYSTIFAGNGLIGGYAWFERRMGVYSYDEGNNPYWMVHEFIGHAFSGLADEYASSCNYMGGPAALKGPNYHNAGNGNCLNVTWTQDTTLYYKDNGSTTNIKSESNGNPCVPWKPFLGRPGYEKVGLYQGGFYCPTSVWKPEDFSVMVNWDGKTFFNAQSRWLIYKTIMTQAGVQKTPEELFEDFLIYDQKHIN